MQERYSLLFSHPWSFFIPRVGQLLVLLCSYYCPFCSILLSSYLQPHCFHFSILLSQPPLFLSRDWFMLFRIIHAIELWTPFNEHDSLCPLCSWVNHASFLHSRLIFFIPAQRRRYLPGCWLSSCPNSDCADFSRLVLKYLFFSGLAGLLTEEAAGEYMMKRQ